MNDYKRLTMREFAGVTGHAIYNRLAELEDKIESGELVDRNEYESTRHRAEVAERKYMIALNKYAKCDRKLTHYNKMTTTYDKEITKQAEKELSEEGKK